MTKHPLLEEREYRLAYRGLQNRLFLSLAVRYYAALLAVISVVSLLAWPAVDHIFLLILCSSGLAVCIALAGFLSRRRAIEQLSNKGRLPVGWAPPDDEFY